MPYNTRKTGICSWIISLIEKEFKELEKQRALADFRRDLGSILRPHTVDNNFL